MQGIDILTYPVIGWYAYVALEKVNRARLAPSWGSRKIGLRGGAQWALLELLSTRMAVFLMESRRYSCQAVPSFSTVTIDGIPIDVYSRR